MRARVVFGLRQKIGGDPVRVAGPVGEDQDFGRPGDHVDADLAEHDALGRGDIGIARTDDLGDRRDGRGAVGERRNRLRPADAVDLVNAGDLRRRQHQRRQDAAWRRHHHDQPRHAGDLGRHCIHQHRRRIGGGAAGHVKPDCLDRGPAGAKFDAERIGEAIVARQLPAVKRLDAIAREGKRIDRFAVARRCRPSDLLGRHPQSGRVDREPIELLGVFAQRDVTARRDVGYDGANRRLDVGRHFALGVKEGAELLGEIGGARVETDGHLLPGTLLPGVRDFLRARRGDAYQF